MPKKRALCEKLKKNCYICRRFVKRKALFGAQKLKLINMTFYVKEVRNAYMPPLIEVIELSAAEALLETSLSGTVDPFEWDDNYENGMF